MVDQLLILNNKKSKKVGFKRRDALVIAQQIRQFLADRGVLLPHSADRLFGRGFKASPSLKTLVSREIHEEYDLPSEKHPDHFKRWHGYRSRIWRRVKFTPVDINSATGFPIAPGAFELTAARKFFPKTLDQFRAEDLKHLKKFANYEKRAWRKVKFIPVDIESGKTGFPVVPWNFEPVPMYKYLPKNLKQFTQWKYKELKKARIRVYRKDYDGMCAEKAIMTFVDRDTGELLYDDYNQLARAYYALYQCSPATYAIFKNPDHDAFSSQGITFTCSKHRIDPVWNYIKSKKLRSSVHAWMAEERIHERFQPMHLVLTVPHPDGKWMGKSFYAKEMVQKFNLLRKSKLWNQYIYGGLQCLEITRKGKNGLHIHIHAMVLQNPQYTRNEVADFIQKEWERSTGGIKCWYETLYIHKRVNPDDKKSAWICEVDENGEKIWDPDRQEYKKKKFYLDEKSALWFRELSPEDKFQQYVNGVLECIKYHFKYESFKTGRKINGTNVDEWDIQLIADVLKHSKNLRMFDKFGALYGVKQLSMSYIEAEAAKESDHVIAKTEDTCDGVEFKITNPYTGLPALKGEYVRVLAMPQYLNYYGPQQNYRPIVDKGNHDVYFLIKPDIPIKKVIEAIMKKTWQDILEEPEYRRLQNCNWQWIAPRERITIEIKQEAQMNLIC